MQIIASEARTARRAVREANSLDTVCVYVKNKEKAKEIETSQTSKELKKVSHLWGPIVSTIFFRSHEPIRAKHKRHVAIQFYSRKYHYKHGMRVQ